ncbi:MAG TPA: hypothetical protein VLE44_02875 [Candidatus Saccharimonadales bacterium]|nr:hypothetical protein [Candidatus Saccharimonadales bacterium]
MKKIGFIQATTVAAYCLFIGFLVFKVNTLFGKVQGFFAPVSFLLLFSTSALICALLVFYRPYILFFKDKKKEAIDLILYTTIFLAVYFVVIITIAVNFKI